MVIRSNFLKRYWASFLFYILPVLILLGGAGYAVHIFPSGLDVHKTLLSLPWMEDWFDSRTLVHLLVVGGGYSFFVLLAFWIISFFFIATKIVLKIELKIKKIKYESNKLVFYISVFLFLFFCCIYVSFIVSIMSSFWSFYNMLYTLPIIIIYFCLFGRYKISLLFFSILFVLPLMPLTDDSIQVRELDRVCKKNKIKDVFLPIKLPSKFFNENNHIKLEYFKDKLEDNMRNDVVYVSGYCSTYEDIENKIKKMDVLVLCKETSNNHNFNKDALYEMAKKSEIVMYRILGKDAFFKRVSYLFLTQPRFSFLWPTQYICSEPLNFFQKIL